MSRIGRMPITVPAGVTVTIAEGNLVTVKGSGGVLTEQLHGDMVIKQEENVLTVSRPSEQKAHKALHGLTRTLLANMVMGVTTGFKKDLEINGVGFRAAMQGSALVLNVGYSHQVTIEQPQGLKIEVPAPNRISVSGCDKQRVGQLAAEIREKRPPEPYKGKGIKYASEVIRRKEGKAGGKKK